MTSSDRVVWDEGMMLAPQHFQQWERWLEAELRDRGQVGSTHGWGFTGLQVDAKALSGGQLAIARCDGFFPDGTAFACPGRDALPPARSVADAFDGKATQLTAYLALPKVVQGSPVYGDGPDIAPLVRRRQRVVDSARPETDREIATARLNLSIRLQGEDLTAYRTLPIGRLLRGAGGGVELAPDSCAPALTIAAAPLCRSVLQQVTGMLTQKWSELSGKRRGAGGGMADAAGLLLLHTAGEHLPVLRHLLEHDGASPEAAFVQLAQLASQLCTFHQSASPSDVPVYRHDDVGPGLQSLSSMLQEMLGQAAPSLCQQLPIQREGEALFWATIPSPNMLTEGSLYLSVRADASEQDVQARLPALAKISSKDGVQELLMRAVPGLPLVHVPQPPAAIPTQTGRVYFRLEPGGPYWDAITQSLTVAFHVSPGLPQLQLELLAVKQ